MFHSTPLILLIIAGIASSLSNMNGSITAWAGTSGNAFGFSFAPDALGGSWGASALLNKAEFFQASYLHYWQYSPEDASGQDINVDF